MNLLNPKSFVTIVLILAILCFVAPSAYAQKSHKRPAATQKIPTSENLLQQAENYYNGTNGVFMNREKAKELFKKAADMGNAKAQKWMFATLVESGSDYPEAMKYLRMAAEQNDTEAITEMGQSYLNGWYGLKQDDEQALYWLRIAAKRDSPHALSLLGCKLFLDNIDKGLGLQYIEKAADLGDGVSCGLISNEYSEGVDIAKDLTKAVLYARKGADLGDAYSQYLYGICLMEGDAGVEKDDKLAFEYFMKSAKQECRYAYPIVADFYHYGWGGLTASKDEAKKWYVKASESGSAKASLIIADSFCPDGNEKLSWYQKSADQGSVTAQAELAWAHCAGKIPDYDVKAGVQELKKLMNMGNPRAIAYYADILRQGGAGIRRDKKEARRLFESIKDSDDDIASFMANYGLVLLK